MLSGESGDSSKSAHDVEAQTTTTLYLHLKCGVETGRQETPPLRAVCFHFPGREKEEVAMKTKYKRAYKYRMYPNDEQQRILARTFGCVRFVYNYFLRLRKQVYLQEQQSLNYHQTSALLTALKKQAAYV
jgi:hypothetical protein